MKIGILTYQRAENYGALLQAYALKTTLEQAGYNVEMVDYWPEYHENVFKLFSKTNFKKRSFLGKVKYLILFAFSFNWLIKRKKNLNRFMKEKLDLGKHPKYTKKNDVCKEYDIVIYGSDQIWRKQSIREDNWFDDWYFGSDNIQAKVKLAYAASMGVMDVKENEKAYLKNTLKNFDTISVREKDLNSLLEDLGFKSRLVIDPVFLLKQDSWCKLIKEYKLKKSTSKYILFYNLLNSAESERFTNQLESYTGFEVIEVTKKMSFNDVGKRYVKSASIQEFLNLINNAEFIVSNSFHGVALSIILEKQFYAVGFGERSSRVITLLESLELTNRFLFNINAIVFDEDEEIDFTIVKFKLDSLYKRSFAYLIDTIEKYNNEVK